MGEPVKLTDVLARQEKKPVRLTDYLAEKEGSAAIPTTTLDEATMLPPDAQPTPPLITLTPDPEKLQFDFSPKTQEDISTGKPQLTPIQLESITALNTITKNAFSGNPIFKDPKYREIYYNTLLSRYPQLIVDQVKKNNETMEQSAPGVLAQSLAAPMEMLITGTPHGLKKVGEGLDDASHPTGGNIQEVAESFGKGMLKAGAGLIETGMSLANLHPVMAGVTSAFKAAELTGQTWAEWAMPVTKGVSEYYESKGETPPEWVTDAAMIVEMAALGFLGAKAHNAVKKFKGDLSASAEITTALNETFKNPKELNAVIEAGGDPVLANKIVTVNDLKEAAENPVISDQIKGEFINPKIEEISAEITMDLGKKIGETTALAEMRAQRDHLLDQQSQLPESTQGLLQPKIDELNGLIEQRSGEGFAGEPRQTAIPSESAPKAPATERQIHPEIQEFHKELTKEIETNFKAEKEALRKDLSAERVEGFLRFMEMKNFIKIEC